MRQVIMDIKAIMGNKLERREFLGGLVCALLMMAIAYTVIVIFGK